MSDFRSTPHGVEEGKNIKIKKDTFGINIGHERYMEEHMQAGDNPSDLLAWHEKKHSWIQHERFVHLIVMVMTALVELVIVLVVLFHPET